MTVPDRYLQKIRMVYPQLSLDNLEFNQDGMNNDVVIVNHQIVCRFTKPEWAQKDLQNEVNILQIVQKFVDLPVPRFDHVDDFVSYALIRGEPLSRHQLFRLDSPVQEKVIEQLGQFLQQLHSIPSDALAAYKIPFSAANRSREDLLDLYEKVQEISKQKGWTICPPRIVIHIQQIKILEPESRQQRAGQWILQQN